jgi:hypothetical protein
LAKTCGARCPVCGNDSYPLARCRGRCEHGRPCNHEADLPWRLNLHRIAHKCIGNKHRFDVDSVSHRPLADFAVRLARGSKTVTYLPAGQQYQYEDMTGF